MLLFLNERSFIFKKQGGAKMAPPLNNITYS